MWRAAGRQDGLERPLVCIGPCAMFSAVSIVAEERRDARVTVCVLLLKRHSIHVVSVILFTRQHPHVGNGDSEHGSYKHTPAIAANEPTDASDYGKAL